VVVRQTRPQPERPGHSHICTVSTRPQHSFLTDRCAHGKVRQRTNTTPNSLRPGPPCLLLLLPECQLLLHLLVSLVSNVQLVPQGAYEARQRHLVAWWTVVLELLEVVAPLDQCWLWVRGKNKQAGRQAGKQENRQTGRKAGTQAGKQDSKQAGRQGDRQANKQAGRQAGASTNALWYVEGCTAPRMPAQLLGVTPLHTPDTFIQHDITHVDASANMPCRTQGAC
jgi:hypothetical protein